MFLRKLLKTSSTLANCRKFSYSHAIVRELPSSFAELAIKMNPTQQICQRRAEEQWRNYVETLERCGLKVISLPGDEKNPDCVFVEDAAVVIGQKACMSRPGHPTRRNEVEVVRQCLHGLGLDVHELDDPTALLDGGDVLFTGEEIFVGQSTRTNKAGMESLQRVFSPLPVIPVPIKSALHLKSVATLAQHGLLAVGGSADAWNFFEAIREHSKRNVHGVVQLKKDESANVLFINGQVVLRTEKELGPDFKTLTCSLSVPWVPVAFDELYKAEGCLTCCSILLQVP